MKHSLFRSIRHKLLNEGKLLRYLSYAVGEVVLIIVGILMALKINDWNEDRKAQVELGRYVTQLIMDVKQAISNCEHTMEIADRFASEGSAVLPLLREEKLDKQQIVILETGLDRLGAYPELQIHVGFLSQLLNGNMETIGRDEELARKAIEMESMVELHMGIISHLYDQLDLAINNLVKFRGKREDLLAIGLIYDLEELKTSKEFHYTTHQILNRTMSVKERSEQIKEILNDFLMVLEEYE